MASGTPALVVCESCGAKHRWLPQLIGRQLKCNCGNLIRVDATPALAGAKESARPAKRRYGGYMMPVFQVLARLKSLRGTRFDVFGYSATSRIDQCQSEERPLIPLDELLGSIPGRPHDQHYVGALAFA